MNTNEAKGIEAVDLKALVPPPVARPKKSSSDVDHDVQPHVRVDGLEDLVDRAIECHQFMEDMQRELERVTEELRQKMRYAVEESVAKGLSLMNARAYGTSGCIRISVRASSSAAHPDLADNLARDYGRYVYNILDHKESVKVKNPRGLLAAAKRAGIDVSPFIEHEVVAKPQARWPERLAMAGLPADVVRGIFRTLMDDNNNIYGDKPVAHAPMLTVLPGYFKHKHSPDNVVDLSATE